MSSLHKPGLILWFTGLSGAGKTTICMGTAAQLATLGYKLETLDADACRETICRDLGFTDRDRVLNIERLCRISQMLSCHGIDVAVAAITPFSTMRKYLRDELPTYFEIYVDAPLSVCEQRDTKGIYLKHRLGQIAKLTGYDSRYEPPDRPHLICRTAEENTAQSIEKVVQAFRNKKQGSDNASEGLRKQDHVNTTGGYHRQPKADVR